ncbi:Mov34/MPN/PAD-1 family protein [Lysinibacillus xylanilyticus]|uniref:JAB domain-containing protein n=1 Tax=Lysinibacillus xylanilyticus TaxID=582475 RepID=A0A2M9Q5Q9_9BACI|nr:Mov34/MPN/PAD-1 family protein [Lysinibacillus xylanilyticus]PJO43413.1 hypothetical protein CWD94_12755 [Lysinibacillus xylanilyticus]
MYKISMANLRAIRNASVKAFPREICGLIAYDNSDAIGNLIFLDNESKGNSYFEVNPEELYSILIKNYKQIYFFHSHPYGPAVPSNADREGYYPYLYPHLIYSVSFEQFVMYEVDGKSWSETSFEIFRK